MKDFPNKVGRHLRRNAKKYIVIAGTTTLVVVAYGALLTVNDMENFLQEKGLFEEWQNQPVV
jgi:hypothetical protein